MKQFIKQNILYYNYRKLSQERKIKSQNRKYKINYNSTKINKDILEDELAPSKLKIKIRDTQIKKNHDLNILLIYYQANWEKAIEENLKCFGNLKVFNLKKYSDDIIFDNKTKDIINNDLLNYYFDCNKINEINIVFCYTSPEHIFPNTLKKIRENGPFVVNMCLDDVLNFPGERTYNSTYNSVAGYFDAVDINLTNKPSSIQKYSYHGSYGYFFPECADANVFYNLDAKKEYDVSFIGQKYGDRPIFIKRLRDKGINVKCFGRGWKGGEVSIEEMNIIYSKSWINLGFSEIGYCSNYKCLKGRDFEVPISGNFYLTSFHKDLSLVYKIGTEIYTFNDYNDCIKKIKFLLNNKQTINKISFNGQQRAVKDHSYKVRFERLFNQIGFWNIKII